MRSRIRESILKKCLKSLMENKLIKNLPNTPGVYLIKDSRNRILYIGKASSIKKRVASYFHGPLNDRLQNLVRLTKSVDFKKTDSVIEALILEANLIKKYQPKYNVKLKDDKSFVNIIISKEDSPRVFVGRTRQKVKEKTFGPYTSAKSARQALRILRKIFPFRSCRRLPKKACIHYQIGQCLGPCISKCSKSVYKKMIRQLILFLQGKRKKLIQTLKKEMNLEAKRENFERAAVLRNRIYALGHIRDVALISKDGRQAIGNIPSRIEAYDISNISGKSATGSMIVFTNGKIDKDEYRLFRIRRVKGIDDVSCLKEVLTRRLNHKEWKFPDLIIIDGGRGQLDGVLSILCDFKLNIPVVAIAKGPTRKKADLYFSRKLITIDKNLLKQIRDEAHRFAIKYHRLLRKKHFLL